MEIIIDTNILFSFFKQDSTTRKIILTAGLRLYSPEFALFEINKHKSDIIKKFKITNLKFTQMRRELAIAVTFLPLEDYSSCLKNAVKISPDPNDIDFFALALKLDLPIWSNDSILKNQKKIVVISTKNLIEKEEFFSLI